MGTASIQRDSMAEQPRSLTALCSAYADACNRPVPVTRKHSVWDRVTLEERTYPTPHFGYAVGRPDVLQGHFYGVQRLQGKRRHRDVSGRTRPFRPSRSTTPACTSTSARTPWRVRPSHLTRSMDAGASRCVCDRMWYRKLIVKTKNRHALACGLTRGMALGQKNLAAIRTGKKTFGGGKVARQAGLAPLPCVVVFRPTGATARDKSSSKSPAKRCGAFGTSTPKRVETSSRPPSRWDR